MKIKSQYHKNGRLNNIPVNMLWSYQREVCSVKFCFGVIFGVYFVTDKPVFFVYCF